MFTQGRPEFVAALRGSVVTDRPDAELKWFIDANGEATTPSGAGMYLRNRHPDSRGPAPEPPDRPPWGATFGTWTPHWACPKGVPHCGFLADVSVR